MPKLSRKEKYKDLRDSLDQESEPQSTTKQVRTNRMAAPDFKADQKMRGPVIDDLLGEVKQYNLDNGELVTDDTQMQILHDLSSQEQAAARRSVHFETMEQNQEPGGTTRNLYGTDLSSLMASQPRHVSTPKKAPTSTSRPAVKTKVATNPTEEPDFLDLFTPGKATQEEPIVEVVEEEETKERKAFFSNPKESTKRKRKKSKRQETYEDPEESELFFDENEDTLDSLFTTTEVSIDAPYFMPQNQNSSNTRQKPSTSFNDTDLDEEEFEQEEEQATNRLSSLFNKVRQKVKKLDDEDEDDEEEQESYVEKTTPIQPIQRKAKESTQRTKENTKQGSTAHSNNTKKKATTQSKEKTQATQKAQLKDQRGKVETTQSNSNDESSVSTPAIIFMVVCCIILVILILLTIFWMSKLGIF